MKPLIPLLMLVSLAASTGIQQSKTLISKQPRIIGGLTAVDGEVPYIALVQYNQRYEYSGAIISAISILTTADCAMKCKDLSNCKVFVGRRIIDSGGQEIKLIDTIWHESYENQTGKVNPLGILRVDKAFPITADTQIIALPTGDFYSSEVHITGWGGKDGWGRYLKTAEVDAIIHKKSNGYELICANSTDIYPCYEEGAPMIYVDKNELAGIANYGCVPNSLYINVYMHLDWIRANYGITVHETGMTVTLYIIEFMVVTIINLIE